MATAPVQKNKRLSERDRDIIMRFVGEQVIATEDRAELDEAYERVADALHAVIVEKNPPRDMKVLERYDCAAPDQCIYISTGGYNYDRFMFREGDKRIPLRPQNRGCSRNAIILEGEAEAAYDDFKAKDKAAVLARAVRLNDFKALVYGTPSFNALAEAWPAVEVLREKIVGTGTALAILSSEVIDRIKADAAFAPELQAA